MTRSILSVLFALSIGGATSVMANDAPEHACTCSKECKDKAGCSKEGKGACHCDDATAGHGHDEHAAPKKKH